ncbi:MAG: WG repeat-containing protein [Bacteroidales bacterium]|nr:WG repeat-containing protein [Bacteroidales bacterium]
MNKILRLFFIVISTSMFFSCGNNTQIVDLLPVKEGDKFQYINTQGQLVINPQFTVATVFREELALVKSSDENPRWGYVNRQGKYEIGLLYKAATVFSEGLAWVVLDNAAPTAINRDGNIQIILRDVEEVRIFKEGLAAISVYDKNDASKKWGFINKSGFLTINPQFVFAGNFSNGMCAVHNAKNQWGFIDKSGTIKVNYQYDTVFSFVNDRAIVVKDGKYGVIDKSGKTLIEPQFRAMINDGDTYAVQQTDKKWGWCNVQGELIINPQFEQVQPFLNNAIAPAAFAGRFGFIDKKGAFVVNPQFDSALPFNGDLAQVVMNKKVGFVGSDGVFVINPVYNSISPDFEQFITNGTSTHESVQSDYYNFNSLLDALNFSSPDGNTDSTTFYQIMRKYNLHRGDFNETTNEYKIINNRVVSSSFSYDLFIHGKVFDEILPKKLVGKRILTAADSTQIQYEFNHNNEVLSYFYVVHFADKLENMESMVRNILDKELLQRNYTEVSQSSTAKVFENQTEYVRTYIGKNCIALTITFKPTERTLERRAAQKRTDNNKNNVK